MACLVGSGGTTSGTSSCPAPPSESIPRTIGLIDFFMGVLRDGRLRPAPLRASKLRSNRDFAVGSAASGAVAFVNGVGFNLGVWSGVETMALPWELTLIVILFIDEERALCLRSFRDKAGG